MGQKKVWRKNPEQVPGAREIKDKTRETRCVLRRSFDCPPCCVGKTARLLLLLLLQNARCGIEKKVSKRAAHP
jgi:hypothetical protein